ncbi:MULTISPECIES: FAD-binding protein [unclassified Pseudoalteromonas]|uniref:FAD-binding protein n=1 Tax=unclassified Pseudoalteromonas TaxID=194690 RepID=UPI002096EABE|nr:FAD-binding protein [Pseudoalteromonas sp. XMcav2-N]MCO7189178.1 FAD-binding protein [Pseudoalteromonas sp. XMcav2-N]
MKQEKNRSGINPNVSSRRHFLKTSLAMGGAIGAAPLMLSNPAAASSQYGQYHKVYADDARYDSMLTGSNLRFPNQPGYIAVCSSAHEVYMAAREAVANHLRITVRSGGHCYEGFVVNDQGVVVDLSNMDRVYRSDDYYVVEAGASLGHTYKTLFKEFGVIMPGGSCFGVGVGGHVCGGGFGIHSRQYGLSSDYLAGVELISFDQWGGQANYPRTYFKGQSARADEIVWAHQGGGGGNFGIVTKYFFKDLPPVPAYLHLQEIALPWHLFDYDQFAMLLRNFGEFWQTHNGPDSRFNPLHVSMAIPNSVGGSGEIRLSLYCSGDPALIDEFIDMLFTPAQLKVAKKGLRITNHMGLQEQENAPQRPVPPGSYFSMPWWYGTQYGAGTLVGARGKNKSAYMKKPFPEAQIQTLWNTLRHGDYLSPGGMLQLSSYGGQINALSQTETAVSHRDSIMKLQYQTYWFEAAQDPYHIGWINGFYHAMYGDAGPVPDEVMDGCYVNYADVDIPDWQHLYYKHNYVRLQQVKRQLDPNNQLHHAQSIEV